MTEELLPNEEFSIYLSKKPLYDDYAINPYQLERIVESGEYKVHLNYYDERVFGPPAHIKGEKQ